MVFTLRTAVAVAALAWAGAVSLGCRQNPPDAVGLTYPETLRDTTIIDDYHGTAIEDPYRWLENDTAVATAAWVDAQNAFTQAYLGGIDSRAEIKKRLTRLYDYERYGTPEVVGEWLYFTKNDGLQAQSLLLRQRTGGGDPELVLDPNTFSDDNTASLAGYSFDGAGRYMAYRVSEAGSDWNHARVLDLSTLSLLPDSLADLKFTGISWQGDGFFYSRYPSGDGGARLSGRNVGQQVYYHRLGEPQSSDRLVFGNPQFPERNAGARVSDDEQWLVITSSQGTSGNSVAVARLSPGGKVGPIVTVVDDFEDDYYLVHGRGERLLFWTDAGASNGRLVALDAARPAAGFEDVIPVDPRRPLKGVTVSGDRMYARYLQDVSSRLEVFSLDGAPLDTVALPGLGTVGGVSAAESGGPVFYSFSSFTSPGTVFRLDPGSTEAAVWHASDNGFDESRYDTKQVWYRSKDGTRVPMFVIHRRGLELDGQRPTLLYGYGGFDIAIEPQHSVMRLDLVSPILEQDGVVAVASLRGGGEYGKDWHEAGTKERKQNVFDDFIAAAEYLQAEGYTSPGRTAIYGRSNGGLLVGACITQRPELFGVAFPAVGVLDMLRYHQFTIGYAWAADYGRADSADAFRYLRAYSPLHNVREAAYPATMITTADHDDRVVPAHSFKFAAELQHRQTGPAPILIRIDEGSGHAAGKPVGMQIDEATDVLAFMFHEMGVEYRVVLEANAQ